MASLAPTLTATKQFFSVSQIDTIRYLAIPTSTDI